MKVKATFLKDDSTNPITFGEIELINQKQSKLKGLPPKEGILAYPVFTGFCGTDAELLRMASKGELHPKFPTGTDRLINGHEGVVYVPSQKRFAIVLIRGGDSYDPTRYGDNETYFEYGCDKMDGIMAEAGYYHPDMLLEIPQGLIKGDKIDVKLAKRLTFSDPYACMLFQLERMEDLGAAHNFRVEMAKEKIDQHQARAKARENTFNRTVIFGMGTTGMLLGHAIKRKHPDCKLLFIGRSKLSPQKQQFLDEIGAIYALNDANDLEASSQKFIKILGGKATSFAGCSGTLIESKLALEVGLLSNNGIYNSFSLGPNIEFNTMKFGFANYLIFGSINFRESHMLEAIKFLSTSNFDKLVQYFPLEQLEKDPQDFYLNTVYSKNSPLKSAVSFNPSYINFNEENEK